MDKTNTLKITIVGDVAAGKTWLWQSYFQNRKPPYVQTMFDNYSTSVLYNGQEVLISLFEMCGDEEYAELRKVIYPGTNVVILCIAVDNPESVAKSGNFGSLERWSLELKDNCKGIPIVIVGTKKDLRGDPVVLRRLGENKLKPLKYKDIIKATKKFKNAIALDCSSISKDGVQDVFKAVVKLGLRNKSYNK